MILLVLVGLLFTWPVSGWAGSSTADASEESSEGLELGLRVHELTGKMVTVTEDAYCTTDDCTLITEGRPPIFIRVDTSTLTTATRVFLAESCSNSCTLAIRGRMVDEFSMAPQIIAAQISYPHGYISRSGGHNR